ncbi:MAG TPA: hypothetical protein VJO16_16935 [Candidatus Acidoferrum sp.]|nr:hypothetical protein [Candidatus Acidoferrum sp.]
MNNAPTTAPPTAKAAVAAAPAGTTTITPANSTQSQLLALNSALYALGLNDSQLAQIDQIASLIQVFNPLAFTSLVYQLEALAQTSAQQAAAPISKTASGTPSSSPATANTPAAAVPAAGTSGNTAGPNTTGGFQIQELVIKFSGVQESFAQTGSGAQGGNSNTQLSAFSLQVEEINLTLSNPAGQSFQVTSPQAAAAPTSPSPATAQAKSAAA